MMKNIWMILAVAALLSCGDDNEDLYGSFLAGSMSTTSGSDAGSVDFSTTEIEFDDSFLDEGTESIPADDNDYVENSLFEHVVEVVFDGSSAVVTDVDGVVEAEVNGAHVVVGSSSGGVHYILSGTSDNGSFKTTNDEKKIKVTLNGLTLSNPSGAVINNQSHKSFYLVLGDGTDNTLTDGTTYDTLDDEDMKGTIFSEGQILLSGNGRLFVNANCKNGVASDDYVLFRPGNVVHITSTAGNGVKANDGVIIRGGVLNVGVSDGGSKGINSEGYINVEGGRTVVITTGSAIIEDDDTKSCAGMKSDSMLTISAGTVLLKSTGAGGKGIGCDTDILISGGETTVVTTGSQYVSGRYDSSPKGIKGDSSVVVSGGDVIVSCSGGEGAEGIESKSILTVSGGNVVVSSYDDALNASSRINISGGRLFANASSNDAVDSNGTLYISGGVVIALGTTTPEGPFDCDNSTFSVTGGTIIGLGGESSVPTTSATTQPVVMLGGKSYTKGTYMALTDDSGVGLFSFYLPRNYSSSVLVVSSPDIQIGNTYNILSGVDISGGSFWQGYSEDASFSGGSVLQSVKISNYVTTSGTSNSTIGPNITGGFGGRW